MATFTPLNYLLAGKVVDASVQPVAGIPINGLPEYLETDESGIFEIALPAGWSGNLSPYSDQCSFIPDSYRINDLQLQEHVDFEMKVRDTFDISGIVMDVWGQPLMDVSLNGFPNDVKTDANGNFVAKLPKQWSGNIIPELFNYRFVPSVLRIIDTQVDLHGLYIGAIYLGEYLVSGTIADQTGIPIPDVDIVGFPVPVKTDTLGQFLLKLPSMWSGTIYPLSSCYVFNPESIDIAPLQSDLPSQNFQVSVITDINTGPEINMGHPYPNPSTGIFTIDLPKNSGKSYLEVFSSTGSKISDHIINDHQDNFRFIIDQRGPFTVRLSSKRKAYLFKVIVN
jgi:hypothetical protein